MIGSWRAVIVRPASCQSFCDGDYNYMYIKSYWAHGSGVTLLEGARGQGMAGCPID